MLTKRDNLLEMLRGGHPDRYVNQYEAFSMLMKSPLGYVNPPLKKGDMNVVNAWGVTKSFPENVPGAFPVHTPEKIVIKDITRWRDYVTPPNLIFPDEAWEDAKAYEQTIDRNEYFATAWVTPGIFEQCHYLMEIQNCLINLYDEPEAMHEVIDMLTEWELTYAKELCRHLHPDAIVHHDDWGSQISTFISPDMFEEFIFPAYKKIYGYYKEHGVQVIVHHSDSYAATLVPNMIRMGIDIWQGVMRTNNIPELLEKYGGQIAFMGGINNADCDREDWNGELVRKAVARAILDGSKYSFIPCLTAGGPGSTYPGVYAAVSEEIARVNANLTDF